MTALAAPSLPSAPQPAQHPRSRTAANLCRAGRILCLALAFSVITTVIYFVLKALETAPDHAEIFYLLEIEPGPDALLSADSVVRATALLYALDYLLPLWGLFCARRLFGDYLRGAALTPITARRLEAIGWAYLIWTPLDALGYGVIGLLADQRLWGEMQWDSTLYALSLFFGFLLVVVGRVLADAARLAEDNAGFV